MHISIKDDEIAYLAGLGGTLAIAKTNGNFFYLETESEEVVLFTDPVDLIVASSFGVGQKVMRGLCCTIYQLRELGAPLIVLPKGHPASSRLKTIVSIGSSTHLSCHIEPGTHPEQDVLCGSTEFNGMQVLGNPGGAEIIGWAQTECEIIVRKL
ncbi:MAG: hypothetical protein A4E49_00506 [Methanosaeta sp. PtaU1.Bin112]|nr:MAG: hypothetical protein A4E49_00506 [Methanosaeta sp. PtaU1.Bin112]